MNLTNSFTTHLCGNMIINICLLIALVAIVVYIVRNDFKCKYNEHYTLASTIDASSDITANNINISTASFKDDNSIKNFRSTIKFDDQCKSLIDSTFTSYLEKYKNTMLNIIFPVGCIYISASSTKPAFMENFGTWERVCKDYPRYLVSAIDGNNELTVGKSGDGGLLSIIGTAKTDAGLGADKWYNGRCLVTANKSLCYTDTDNTRPLKHLKNVTNKLLPYYACYFWKRTE